MSLYGVENLIYLIVDNPGLAGRFRDAILKAMLEMARILDEEAGYSPATAPHGFYFCDDNCAMLNAEMYEFFGYPILKAMFDRYSPNPGDTRSQHSDSDMAQHLPALGRLGMTSVNFGPNLTVTEIREHLPKAVICGQLAPFTFSRNEEVNMVAELIRDFEMAREKRGLIFATAGSINNGSRLTGMRLLMAAIQEYGRYG
jgi:uroporphyrinogen decarboxylase